MTMPVFCDGDDTHTASISYFAHVQLETDPTSPAAGSSGAMGPDVNGGEARTVCGRYARQIEEDDNENAVCGSLPSLRPGWPSC